LDVRDMKALDIDPDGRTAWAETGLTAAEYSTAAGAHGLATGFGDTGCVGIGGITLGGGIGYLTRKHGLTIDSVLAAELVTADGDILHIDASSHPDVLSPRSTTGPTIGPGANRGRGPSRPRWIRETTAPTLASSATKVRRGFERRIRARPGPTRGSQGTLRPQQPLST
jgi:hypothetical protein